MRQILKTQELPRRYILTKFRCPYCREVLKAIRKINLDLPVDKQIRIIDSYAWEYHGVMLEPILMKFDKIGFDGYPYIYIDGIVVKHTNSMVLYKYFRRLFKEELIN